MANVFTEKLLGDSFIGHVFLQHFFINLSKAEIKCLNSAMVLTHLNKLVF